MLLYVQRESVRMSRCDDRSQQKKTFFAGCNIVVINLFLREKKINGTSLSSIARRGNVVRGASTLSLFVEQGLEVSVCRGETKRLI